MDHSPPPHSPHGEQVVVHYHYHYYFDTPPSLTEHPEGLRRVRSDHKDPLQRYSGNSETESSSSQQSWKRLIKPQLQSTSPTPRSHESTSFLKPPHPLDKTSPHSCLRTTISDFALHTPRNPERKERSISSKLPVAMQFQTGTPSNFSPIRPAQSEWDSPPGEHLSAKSRFSKKRQIQILSAHKLKQLTERERGHRHRQEQPSYRSQLLEEECLYLREKFMGHLEREHRREMQ